MQTSEQTVTDTQRAEQRKLQQRTEMLRELNIDAKTDAEKAEARLNRVQLFHFLTECMDALLNKQVLMSRPSANRMWCQTGFFIEASVVYAKFGESMMQPIGWDTGTEFYMTNASKFLWKHEFAMVAPEAAAMPAPFTIRVSEKEEDSDQGGLTKGERDSLGALAKDIVEILDLKKPEDFKRPEDFKPKKAKAKWGPGELIEKVRTWLTENEAQISADARAYADAELIQDAKTTDGTLSLQYAEACKEIPGVEMPTKAEWAAGRTASRFAEERSSEYARTLAAETSEYTEAELDAMAWQAEHRERAVEALKYWSLNSRLLDDRLKKLFQEHPELDANFDRADILGLLASVVAWANTSLTDDRISRVIRSTTVTPLITVDGIAKAEADVAKRLIPMVEGARKALGSKVDEIEDNDPRLLRALGVVSQARLALPVVEVRIQEIDGVLVDAALDEILVVLKAVIAKVPQPVTPPAV